jgi:hypothetical protein
LKFFYFQKVIIYENSNKPCLQPFAELMAHTDFQKGFQQQICQNSFNSSFFIVHVNSIMFLLKIRSFLSFQISELSHVSIGQENSLLFGQIKDSELKKG